MKMKKTLAFLLMLALLLLAAVVRWHNLGTQSFWYDEGVAYGHSQRTLAELIPALQRNVHVPAYFGLLAFYEDFVGSSEFALRSLSVLFSLLSVAFTYALGKRLYGYTAGLAAAAFVALNTFSIYYAQETRMYAMLAAVGAASMWVFVGFWQTSQFQNMRAQHVAPLHQQPLFRYALALSLLNALGMYTHVSYALVMVAQGVLAVLWLGAEIYNVFFTPPTAPLPEFREGESKSLLQQERGSKSKVLRVFVFYVAANLLTIAFFLPWAGTAVSQVGSQPNISDIKPLGELLRLILGWFTFGNTFEDNIGGMGAVISFLLIFGLLLLPNRTRRDWWQMLLPAVWVIVSAALYVYLELYARYLRFLLPAQIGAALWLGRGIWVLWRLQTREKRVPLRYLPKAAALMATMAIMVNMANGLAPLYNDADYQRDDYRGLAQTIANLAQPDDAVILSAPGLQEIFGYYYDGAAPVYSVPTTDDIRSEMATIISTHRNIFVVLYGAAEQDPDGIVESTLNTEAYQLSDVWWGAGDVRYVRYSTPAEFTALVESGAQFGDAIILNQYALSATTVKPGDALQLQLVWQTSASLTTRYKVFVQLLNENGILMAQRDSEPGGGIALTTDWQPDTPITDNHALLIPETLAPGDYTLIVGLYDLNDASVRLPVSNATALDIGTIQIR
jgi:mannosyltransferase